MQLTAQQALQFIAVTSCPTEHSAVRPGPQPCGSRKAKIWKNWVQLHYFLIPAMCSQAEQVQR